MQADAGRTALLMHCDGRA